MTVWPATLTSFLFILTSLLSLFFFFHRFFFSPCLYKSQQQYLYIREGKANVLFLLFIIVSFFYRYSFFKSFFANNLTFDCLLTLLHTQFVVTYFITLIIKVCLSLQNTNLWGPIS